MPARSKYCFPSLSELILIIVRIRRALIHSITSICPFPSDSERTRIISGMRWIGLFSSEKAVVRGGNLLDTLCARLETLMRYEQGERDLVMLQHKFVVEWKDGSEVRLSLRYSLGTANECVNDAANYHLDSGGLWKPIARWLFSDGASRWPSLWDCNAARTGRRVEHAWSTGAVQ
jgi:hypothetical protein